MRPFDPQAVQERFLAKVAAIKAQTGETTAEISTKIAARDRINNIKRGLASVDLELLHNFEQVYGVEQYEIITGISLQQQRQELEAVTAAALAKMQEIQQLLQK
jgi:hypothetical protein